MKHDIRRNLTIKCETLATSVVRVFCVNTSHYNNSTMTTNFDGHLSF